MEKSVEEFQGEKEIAKGSNNNRAEGFSDLSLANVYQLLGRWEDASEAVQQGLQVFTQIKDVGGQTAANAELVTIYSDREHRQAGPMQRRQSCPRQPHRLS